MLKDIKLTGRTHKLKTWVSFFQAVKNGTKRFEFRVNDRDFAVGDVLVLQEWDPGGGASKSGAFVRGSINDEPNSIKVVVTSILQGCFGVPSNCCVMSIVPLVEFKKESELITENKSVEATNKPRPAKNLSSSAACAAVELEELLNGYRDAQNTSYAYDDLHYVYAVLNYLREDVSEEKIKYVKKALEGCYINFDFCPDTPFLAMGDLKEWITFFKNLARIAATTPNYIL